MHDEDLVARGAFAENGLAAEIDLPFLAEQEEAVSLLDQPVADVGDLAKEPDVLGLPQSLVLSEKLVKAFGADDCKVAVIERDNGAGTPLVAEQGEITERHAVGEDNQGDHLVNLVLLLDQLLKLGLELVHLALFFHYLACDCHGVQCLGSEVLQLFDFLVKILLQLDLLVLEYS